MHMPCNIDYYSVNYRHALNKLQTHIFSVNHIHIFSVFNFYFFVHNTTQSWVDQRVPQAYIHDVALLL
jgi:hypothetical protein